MPYGEIAIILSTQDLISGGNVIPCPPSSHTNSNREDYIEVVTFLKITTPRPLIYPALGHSQTEKIIFYPAGCNWSAQGKPSDSSHHLQPIRCFPRIDS